ncbi:hypothetical protein [Actinoplanes regularis]|uniref:hypothetical protein n=1 Tax=Actinoplanes regularis TaxID=52697 RepID=UPI00249FB8BC|nr:hypothetical protein [Actinoplanes regularis]GLW29368.1 hypothetical protein Areg01_23080 [Actinoplanes regularis]
MTKLAGVVEAPLPAGRMTAGITRRGGQLLRPMGAWSGAVQDYLRYLAAAGFSGAPGFPPAPPDQLREVGFDPIPDLAARLRTFVDAYGLSDWRPILPALHRCRLLAAERIKYAPVSPAEAADALEHHARELRWLHAFIANLDRQ